MMPELFAELAEPFPALAQTVDFHPVITQSWLEQKLGICQSATDKKSALPSHGRGIGRLSLWRLLQGADNWFEIPVLPSLKRRIRVIVANPFISQLQPGAHFYLTQEIFSQLIKNFDCYAWSTCQPFIEHLPLKQAQNCVIEGATAQRVAESLVAQGLDPLEFVIVDFARWCNLEQSAYADMGRLLSEQGVFELDLLPWLRRTARAEQYEMDRAILTAIQASIDLRQIRIIKTAWLDKQLITLFELFPALTCITGPLREEAALFKLTATLPAEYKFNYTSNQYWFVSHPTRFAAFDPALSLSKPINAVNYQPNNKYHCFADTSRVECNTYSAGVSALIGVERLILDFSQLSAVDLTGWHSFLANPAANTTVLQELRLKNYSGPALDLRQLENLLSLVLTDCELADSEDNNNLALPTKLQRLGLEKVRFQTPRYILDLTQCSALEVIKITHSEVKYLAFHQACRLQGLFVDGAMIAQSFLPHYLKILSVRNWSGTVNLAAYSNLQVVEWQTQTSYCQDPDLPKYKLKTNIQVNIAALIKFSCVTPQPLMVKFTAAEQSIRSASVYPFADIRLAAETIQLETWQLLFSNNRMIKSYIIQVEGWSAGSAIPPFAGTMQVKRSLTQPQPLVQSDLPVTSISKKFFTPAQQFDSDTMRRVLPYSATGNVIFELHNSQGKAVDRTKIRFQLLNRVNEQLEFFCEDKQKLKHTICIEPLEFSQVESLKTMAAQQGYACGSMVVEQPQVGTYYPLPTATPLHYSQFQRCFATQPAAVEIYYSSVLQQFSVRLRQPVSVMYWITDLSDYQAEAFLSRPIREGLTLLPAKLWHFIFEKLADSPLNFLLDQKLALPDMVQRLIHYCRNFTEAPTMATDPYEQFWEIATEAKGACRHRSWVLMILLQFLGVQDVLLNRMATHEIVELYGPIDLAGYELNDQTPASAYQLPMFMSAAALAKAATTGKPVTAKTSAAAGSVASSATITHAIEAEQTATEILEVGNTVVPASALARSNSVEAQHIAAQKYHALFHKLRQRQMFNTLHQILPSACPTLIHLMTHQSPLQVQTQLRQQWGKSENFLYIHNWQALQQYWRTPRALVGLTQPATRPWQTLFAQQHGLLVINWTEFSSAQLTILKDRLDPTLALGEYPLVGIHLIGLWSASGAQGYNESFMSRHVHYQLAEQFFTTPISAQSTGSAPTPLTDYISVDLFNEKIGWQDKVFALYSEGDALAIGQGGLFEAIEKNCPFVIVNPPLEDTEFDLFMYAVNIDRRVSCNGCVYIVPANTHILTRLQPHPLELANVVVLKQETSSIGRMHLGMHNWYQCFPHSVMDSANTLQAVVGLLQQNTDFIIVGAVTKSAWQALLVTIAQSHPTRLYTFLLAPNACIEGVAQGVTLELLPLLTDIAHTSSLVCLTDDVDYLCQKWHAEHAIALEVVLTPEITDVVMLTAAAELECSIPVTANLKTSSVTTAHVIEILRAGKQVILNGLPSPLLYQQLLPLLHNQPYTVTLTGKVEFLPITARIFWAMPLRASEQLQLIGAYQHCFNVADKFTQPDSYVVSPWRELYRFLQLATHYSIAQAEPILLAVSMYRLQQMIARLQQGDTGLHPNNPIKGLWHAHYAKGTEQYAWLNVLAKLCFAKLLTTSSDLIRWQKLHAIIRRYSIHTAEQAEPHIWSLLNCFNSTKLTEFMPNLENVLRVSCASLLDFAQVKAIWQCIQQIGISSTVVKSLPSNARKMHRQLSQLLKNPAIPVIFLLGLPGVGKTYSVRHLSTQLGFQCFEGSAQIVAWLTAVAVNQTALVWLPDEANCQQPGVYDWLKTFCAQGYVWYAGKQYRVSPQHKVVATGNPYYFPQRYYHEFFIQYAEILYCAEPNRTAIVELFFARQSEAALFFDVMEIMKRYVDYFSFSYRDWKNIATRYGYWRQKRMSKNQALFHTALHECLRFIDETKHAAFRRELAGLCHHSDAASTVRLASAGLFKINPTYCFTREKNYIFTGLQEFLAMRQAGLTAKRGLWLEGDVSVGKFSLIQHCIKQAGLSTTAKNLTQKYYVCNGTDSQLIEILIQAARVGSVVVVNKVNTHAGLDNILLTLLDGTIPSGLAELDKTAANLFSKVKTISTSLLATHPKFRIMATQNSAIDHPGLAITSTALKNRVEFYRMAAMTDAELQCLAAAGKIAEPESFVSAYRQQAGNDMQIFWRAMK